MAYTSEVGSSNLRAEFVDSTVKGFAERMYKFKQALTISSTSAWKNTFYLESPNPLQNAGGLSTKVPRGAQPPQGDVKWDKQSVYIDKFFYEGIILWEDIMNDSIDTQARTLYRIAEKVTKDVDDTIYAGLVGASGIQTVTIAAGKQWSGQSAAIIDDIHNGLALISSSNYDTSNCMLFTNPRDRRSIMRWLSDKGAQFPSVSENIATNGFVGKLAGVDLIVANSVVASEALLLVPKICATWHSSVPFSTKVIEEPFVSLKIRAVEEGALAVTDVNAIVRIVNTRGTGTDD